MMNVRLLAAMVAILNEQLQTVLDSINNFQCVPILNLILLLINFKTVPFYVTYKPEEEKIFYFILLSDLCGGHFLTWSRRISVKSGAPLPLPLTQSRASRFHIFSWGVGGGREGDITDN